MKSKISRLLMTLVALFAMTTGARTTTTSTYALAAGENWVSFNNEVTLDELKDVIVAALPGTSGIVINSQGGGWAVLDNGQWRGPLSSVDVAQMYMINVPSDCEITLEGLPIDPAEHPATIYNGYTWIGFPFSDGMAVTDAFAGFAINSDEIMSQASNTTYNGIRWRGSLSTLEPGQGYIYKSTVTQDRTLVFPTAASRAVSGSRSNRYRVASHWDGFDFHQYEFNQPLVATIMIAGEYIASDGKWSDLEVAAFVGNECRGRAIFENRYVEDFSDPYPVIEMPVYYNNAGEIVTFKMYDRVNGTEYEQADASSIVTGVSHLTYYNEGNEPVLSLNFNSPAGAPGAYTVSVNDGGRDTQNWTVTPAEATTTGVAEGEKVTLKYSGRKRVMSVRATKLWDGDLTKLTGSEPEGYATATNGMTITGTLADGVNVKVMIAADATVTLKDATISGTNVNDDAYKHAGISCLGKATIVLVGENAVTGFEENYPGIHVPEKKTLTIKGDGSLDAKSNGYGCGIGGGLSIPCGDITIEGGSITASGGYSAAGIGSGGVSSCGDILITGGSIKATGGEYAAGIGSGYDASCGDILITGGSVEAEGGDYAAGIGSGFGDKASCGEILITGGTVEAYGGDSAAGIGGGFDATCLDITITNTVTKVKATAGDLAQYSIGAGDDGAASCGTVTIGCTLDADGKPVGGKVGMVETSPYTYYPATTDLSTLTADYEAQDGETLTGELKKNVKISIAEGATVTLSGATISGTDEPNCKWAGLTCLGDATVVLSGENSVKGFYTDYPGIHVPSGSTLTIRGDGSLDAQSNGYGTGIGGGLEIACGNIRIEGGSITATGGNGTAGIGSGLRGSCGDISITGGTIEATGGEGAAGIGSGYNGSCGFIEITSGVTKVTATKGTMAPHSIGKGNGGYNGKASCGKVTIGGTEYWNGSSSVNSGDTYLSQSPLVYVP